MPLYQKRLRQEEKAARVARGESIPLTTEFPAGARNAILHALADNMPKNITHGMDDYRAFLMIMRHILTRDWEVLDLAGGADHVKDVEFIIAGRGTDEQLVDVIEAVFVTLEQIRVTTGYDWFGLEEEERFRNRMNEILDDHDLAYQVVGNKVVPRDSMVMHAEVVAPALSLLHGDPRFEKVEKAFQDALSELKPDGDASDAITDAGTALQEMLIVLGAEGNALGPLLTSARKKDLLGPHDSKLPRGVEQIGEWVGAERSARGDSHKVTNANRDDAWLAVHVVGALILRLEKRL